MSELPWQIVSVTLLAADATRVIIPAPSSGTDITNKRIVVRSIAWSIPTPAAQAVVVESGDGSVDLLRFAASAAGAGQFQWTRGVPLPPSQSLRAQPAAPGPEMLFIVEYAIENTFP